jgi:hypothetical protein
MLGLGAGMNLDRNSDLHSMVSRGRKCEQQRHRQNPGSWPAATSAKVEPTEGTLGLGAGMNLERNSDLPSTGSRGIKCEAGR